MRWEYHGVKRHGILLYTMVYYTILVFICWNMFCVKYVRYNNLHYLPMSCWYLYYKYIIVIYDGMLYKEFGKYTVLRRT